MTDSEKIKQLQSELREATKAKTEAENKTHEIELKSIRDEISNLRKEFSEGLKLISGQSQMFMEFMKEQNHDHNKLNERLTIIEEWKKGVNKRTAFISGIVGIVLAGAINIVLKLLNL